MAADIQHFRMPRSREIPNIGLYLDQTIKYINVVLQPLGCIEATPSMVSNYVKKGYIEKPVKKQYNEKQIMLLLFIMIGKLVLSMDNIETLFKLWAGESTENASYDRFCDDFEQSLRLTFGLGDGPEPLTRDASDDEKLLRSVITTVSNAIYINHRFSLL